MNTQAHPECMSAAIKLGPGAVGVRIIGGSIKGFSTGIDLEHGSEAHLDGVRFSQNETAVRAGPESRLTMEGVRFHDNLNDLLLHFTADVTYVDTLTDRLRVYADDPAYQIPKAIVDDLKRAQGRGGSLKARMQALGRVISWIQRVDWIREKLGLDGSTLAALLDQLRHT